MPAPSSRAAPWVVIPIAPGGLGGDGAESAVPHCFQCCIQFLSTLLLFLTIVQHFLCYLAHVDFLMMLVIYHGFNNYVFFYAKCFVRNDEIKLWNQINPSLYGIFYIITNISQKQDMRTFYTPVWKTDVLCYGNVRPSVRLSVRPSVRPSEFSGLFFNVLWDINLKLGICIQ